jgi:hypothetical protein
MSHEREDECERQVGHSGQSCEVLVVTLLIVFSHVIVTTLTSRKSRHTSLTSFSYTLAKAQDRQSQRDSKCLVNPWEVISDAVVHVH